VDEQGDGWLVSYDNDHSFLNLIDLAEITYDGRVFVREVMSDEIIWTGMVRSHYKLADDQITGLVSIGERSSRLIFMKGDKLFHVLPVINEGSKSRNVLQTLFSKLLFEIDKGTLPALDQMVIMQSTKPGSEVIEFFRDQFIDVDVDMFRPDPHISVLPEELKNNPEALRPYITAIGAAQAASGLDIAKWPNLTLLPEYIRERQRYFSAGLARCRPAGHDRPGPAAHQHVVPELHLGAGRTGTVCSDAGYPHCPDPAGGTGGGADARGAGDCPGGERPDCHPVPQQPALVRNTGQINQGMAQVPNTWLTNLRVAGDELQIEGYTLYRNRIPLGGPGV
jgi:hypothetical protein